MLTRLFLILITLFLNVPPNPILAQNIDQLFEQGNAAQNEGNFTEAERIFRQVIKINPNNADAYRYLGIALRNQGKLEEAIAAYNTAIEINPNYAEVYNNLGVALYYQGKLEEAIAAYNTAIEINPNYAEVYSNLGFALSNQGKLEEAIAAYNKAIEINPNYAFAYIGLGIALYNQGKLEEAIAAYNKAIEINPNYAEVYSNLGFALYNQGKLEEAIAAYNTAIEINPNDAFAYNNLGIALSNQGKLEEAIAAYNTAIEINPNDAFAYNNLGVALYNQGKLEEAIAAYNTAIEINPNDAFAYIGLGIALHDQGKLEEAIAAYNKTLSLADKKADRASVHTLAHTTLGYALQQQGKLEEAIAEYEKALKIDPNNTTAQNNLKEALIQLTIKLYPSLTVVDEQKHIPWDEPLIKELRATVRIIALVSPEGYSIASGWVVKRSGDTVWIVTNRHVISDRKTQRLATDIKVQFFSELEDPQRPRYTATIEKFTDQGESLDLAVLKVSGIPSDIQPLTPYTGRLNRNTPVQVIGHPNALEIPWNTSKGDVMNYNPNNSTFPIDAYVSQGNSGGPVINEQKQIIGMMVTIRRREEVAIAYNPNEPAPNLDDIVPATGDAGIAYRIDIVMEKLQSWGILP
ncbi:Tetratricopeptide TPR_2 repeat protein [Gloeothece citriformis PCC 7424]|uniref:Tetratricopeptide TPR_2 repeat protein n=1 Tax=Gloeothece citriformis (strain PCC 7424) TaxID=65393 RepID=B7K9Z0_GLOC7|nr:serine protease [Gloeothece citriformis]ACK71346.1 Tetratricopeptide TPR_2 repeat protein [Gloeothece citriformis PCC 7424]